MNIGIPRALLYYQYFPMWKTFFEELGGKVVISPPTTKDIIASGASRVVADTCLPVKVFLGHVLSLIGWSDHRMGHRSCLRHRTRFCILSQIPRRQVEEHAGNRATSNGHEA